MTASSTAQFPPWLEIINGSAPILLIAPHGGRAGAAARAMLHPKVNDLQTAEITRELTSRLGARALINTAMDRNELDCNRLSQISQRAPWLLELIADQVVDILDCASHATVLLIHGWNIVEPRIDLGLGLREIGGTLRPPAGAHVSASDSFIRGPVCELAWRLRDAQIHPSYGLRYPGAAAHNLLQGLTSRHASSDVVPLRRLAEIAANGRLNALQLEMSVALRLPGELRESAIGAISDAFLQNGTPSRKKMLARLSRPVEIIRRSAPPRGRRAVPSAAPPSRVGVEFYDPVARLGGMVSFDFGPGAAGGRIMILFDRCRVALFTAEGEAVRERDKLSIGPLALNATPGGSLHFLGPAITVDDGTAYLSVERALARSRLERLVEVDAELEFDRTARPFSELLLELDELLVAAHNSPSERRALPFVAPPHAAFGRIGGTIRLNGGRRKFDASFRLGASFTGLGPQKFITRKMVWSSFRHQTERNAFEARLLELDDHTQHRIARVLDFGRWNSCRLADIQIESTSSLTVPGRLLATASHADGSQLSMEGEPGTFVMLSRPGPEGTRLHTAMGFAEFTLGDSKGAGMYEFSRRVGLSAGGKDQEDGEK
jgi:hypothetical protein